MGDEFAHLTTNASPFVEGASIDVFSTNDVASLPDPVEGSVIFTAR